MAVCVSCGTQVIFDGDGNAINDFVQKNRTRVREKGAVPVYCCIGCNRLSARLEPGWKGKASEVERDAREKLAKAKLATERLRKQLDDADEVLEAAATA